MNECLMSFYDFCPQDRLLLILSYIGCILIGYILGTWKTNKGEKDE